MDKGQEKDMAHQEVDGGKERMTIGRDRGEKREMVKVKVGGEETKAKEAHHPKTERDTTLKEERRGRERGEGIGREGRIDAETETGMERGTGIETEIEIEIGIETETERGKEIKTEIEKEIEREIDLVLHHHHYCHHRGKVGVNVPSLSGH